MKTVEKIIIISEYIVDMCTLGMIKSVKPVYWCKVRALSNKISTTAIIWAGRISAASLQNTEVPVTSDRGRVEEGVDTSGKAGLPADEPRVPPRTPVVS